MSSPLVGTPRLNELAAAIIGLPSFEPGFRVNLLFAELVHLVLSLDSIDLSTLTFDPAHLRQACALAESALERHWAARLAGGEAPEAFPYIGNYEQLTTFEIGVVECEIGSIRARRVAFAGSGPLPLSALLLAQCGANVTAFDIDGEANADAEKWMRRAYGSPRIESITADVTDVDLGGFDVVILAALVGANGEEKRAILRDLGQSMRPGAVLVARSAMGPRCLIYPELPIDALKNSGFGLIEHYAPPCSVLNSAVVAIKR